MPRHRMRTRRQAGGWRRATPEDLARYTALLKAAYPNGLPSPSIPADDYTYFAPVDPDDRLYHIAWFNAPAPEPSDGEYRCANCGGVFTAGWDREQAYEEAARLWGMTREECDASPQVCDDCFRRMTAEMPPSHEYAKAERAARSGGR